MSAPASYRRTDLPKHRRKDVLPFSKSKPTQPFVRRHLSAQLATVATIGQPSGESWNTPQPLPQSRRKSGTISHRALSGFGMQRQCDLGQ